MEGKLVNVKVELYIYVIYKYILLFMKFYINIIIFFKKIGCQGYIMLNIFKCIYMYLY